MRKVLTHAVMASLGIVGLAAGQQASAAIAQASSGNGELVLNVVDTVTGNSYSRDLGITIQNSLPANNASFTLGADANLQSFLSGAGSDGLMWSVVGGGYGASYPGGGDHYVSTVGGVGTTVGSLNNTGLSSFKLVDQNLIQPLDSLNPADTNSAVNASYLVAKGTPGNYDSSTGLWNWNGKSPFQAVQTVGAAQDFYYLATNGSNPVAQVIKTLEGQFLLGTDGTLTYTSANAAAPVPLPAAVWLLGSGLLGFFGISRRRDA